MGNNPYGLTPEEIAADDEMLANIDYSTSFSDADGDYGELPAEDVYPQLRISPVTVEQPVDEEASRLLAERIAALKAARAGATPVQAAPDAISGADQLNEPTPPDGPKAEQAAQAAPVAPEAPPPDGPKAEADAAVPSNAPGAPAAPQQAIPTDPDVEWAKQRAVTTGVVLDGYLTTPGVAAAIANQGMEADVATRRAVNYKRAGAVAQYGADEGARQAEQDYQAGVGELSSKMADRSKAASEKFMKALDDEYDRRRALDAQIATAQIDPARGWTSKSEFAKASGALASGLFRLLQARQGTVGGANPVVASIQADIENDLSAQRANLNKLLQQRASSTTDVDQLVALRKHGEMMILDEKAHRLAGMMAVAKAEIARTGDGATKAKLLNTLGDIEKAYADTLYQRADSVRDLSLAVQGGLDKRAAALVKATGKGPKENYSQYVSSDPLGLLENDPETGDLKYKPSANPTQIGQWKELSVVRGQAYTMLNELRNRAVRQNMLKAGTRLSNANLERIEQLKAHLFNLARKETGSGARLEAKEAQMLEAIYAVGDQGWVAGGPGVRERLEAAINELGNQQVRHTRGVVYMTPDDVARIHNHFVPREFTKGGDEGVLSAIRESMKSSDPQDVISSVRRLRKFAEERPLELAASPALRVGTGKEIREVDDAIARAKKNGASPGDLDELARLRTQIVGIMAANAAQIRINELQAVTAKEREKTTAETAKVAAERREGLGGGSHGRNY